MYNIQVSPGYPTIANPSVPRPDYPGPHNFIAFVMIVTVLCGILNMLSLAFGIPAMICALMVKFEPLVNILSSIVNLELHSLQLCISTLV